MLRYTLRRVLIMIPTLVVISLVYSATRFDDWRFILHEAVRWGLRMTAFLLGIAVVLYVLALFIS